MVYSDIKKIVSRIAHRYQKATGANIDFEAISHDAATRIVMRFVADPGYRVMNIYQVAKNAFRDELGQRKASRRQERGEVFTMEHLPETAEIWPVRKLAAENSDALETLKGAKDWKKVLVFIYRNRKRSKGAVIRGVSEIAGVEWTCKNARSILGMKIILRGRHVKAKKKPRRADG